MPRNATITLTCAQCGCEFSVPYEHRDRTYCSYDCWILYRREHRAEQFWAKKQIVNGCWVWQGQLNRGGYGAVSYHARLREAHRLAWELTHGPIPDGLFVLHHCDNRACFNPDHLFLGTQQDNIDDMIAKGRARHRTGLRLPSEKYPMAKLTAVQVREIRARYAAGGVTLKELGNEYGVTKSTLSEMILRKTWRDTN